MSPGSHYKRWDPRPTGALVVDSCQTWLFMRRDICLFDFECVGLRFEAVYGENKQMRLSGYLMVSALAPGVARPRCAFAQSRTSESTPSIADWLTGLIVNASEGSRWLTWWWLRRSNSVHSACCPCAPHELSSKDSSRS